MNEYGVRLKEWYDGLALREQRAVCVGGVLVLLFVFYQLCWSPLTQHVDALRHRVTVQQKLLVWMQAADDKLQQVTGREHDQVSSPAELLVYLQGQIKQMDLVSQLAGLKPAQNEQVELQFKKVAFDSLITLITTTLNEQPVVVAHFDATAVTAPGLVDADVIFRF